MKWRTAVDNPSLTAEVTLKYAGEADFELPIEMLEAIVPLVHTGDGQIDWMYGDVWQETRDMLVDQDMLAQSVDPFDFYMLTFVEKVYGDAP